MATPRITVRSGASLSFRVNWWPPGYRDARIDSSGHTARLQIRHSTNKRVLVDAREWRGEGARPPGTVVSYIEPGQWEVRLNHTITASLPPHSTLVFELINKLDPDDITELFTSQVVVSPEAVTQVAYAD